MKVCSVEGCQREHHAKGFCFKHYKKLLKYGDPLYTKITREREHHNLYKSSEYKTWQGMIQRCYNKKHINYNRYGGRGITVCEKWRNSFIAFFEDMGAKLFPKTQIDRIDNDGNYEPSNCRWVTPLVNKRNSTSTKLTFKQVKEIRKEYKTKKISQRQLGLKYKIGKSTINSILQNNIWKEEVII